MHATCKTKFLGICLQLFVYISKVFTLQLINQHQVDSILDSNNAFGIIPVISLEKDNGDLDKPTFNHSLLDDASVTLKEYDIVLYALDCRESVTKLCKTTQIHNSLSLYKYIKMQFNIYFAD